ncbi:spore cortex biosynthesis protein YabQ [Carboxydothermus pertinax]|uniref:spore cortex biosynthesis protein YabQ n=1 Tax=Carboxydothermus pertinax TaxID=870242 RepID=UPI00096A8781|nr:spore cortex biosynthesis protein YabQ [Carboxydothermus pertinax]
MGAPVSLETPLREIILFFVAVALGFFFCGLYFLENRLLKRKYRRKKKFLPYFIGDIFYFLLVGSFLVGYFLFLAQGEVRSYGFLGIITGIVLYYFILNKTPVREEKRK